MSFFFLSVDALPVLEEVAAEALLLVLAFVSSLFVVVSLGASVVGGADTNNSTNSGNS